MRGFCPQFYPGRRACCVEWLVPIKEQVILSLSLSLSLSRSLFPLNILLISSSCSVAEGRLLRMVVDSSGARSQGRGKALFLTLKAPIEHLFISYFLCRLIVLYYMTCSTSYASFITFTTTVDLLFWEHVCGLNYFFYCVIVGSICSFLYLEHHSLAKRGNHTVRRRCIFGLWEVKDFTLTLCI